jgi:hypothetical protein
MKIQVRSLAIALAIGIPIAVAATAKSSAAPINGMSIKAAVPTLMTDVRYRGVGIIPIPRTQAIRPIIHIGAIQPITIPASLTAGGDAKAWQRAAPSSRR